MPPRLGQVRRGIAPTDTETLVSRAIGDPVTLPMALFWDVPPWHTWSPLVAQCMFSAMQDRGVLVSALNSELGVTSKNSSRFQNLDGESARASTEPTGPRMVPYRNERYGLDELDFDDAVVVDMQLAPLRDASGRIAYSAEQIERWEATAGDSPLSGGGWVPAMTLPPDVPRLDSLAAKVQQLRTLSPKAAVIVSVTPEWIDENLPGAINAKPDAIMIRFGQLRMEGIAFADFVLRVIRSMSPEQRVPIWLAPPRSMESDAVSVADSIKLIALGASAIAIDTWMKDIIEEINEIPPPSSFNANPAAVVGSTIEAILQRNLDPKLERFAGLRSSLVEEQPGELLGAFDPEVAEKLGLPCIGRFERAQST